MQITLGQQYNVGEKPTVILYIYINRKYKATTWHLNGFPTLVVTLGQQYNVGEKPTAILLLFKKKIRPHLDLLSIPRLWRKKCQNV